MTALVTVLYTILTHAGVGAAVLHLDVLDLDAALAGHRHPGVARPHLARVVQQTAVRPGYAAPSNNNIINIPYAIRSIVCEAFCHAVIRSLGHLVTPSLGHYVILSFCHSVILFQHY